MPLTPAFTVTQSIYDLDVLTLMDTSTGSDPSVTQRRVLLVKYDGTALTPFNSTTDYITWPFTNSTIDIGAILDQDYSLNVIVQFNAIDGSLVAVTEKIVALTGYAESYLLDLTRLHASNPKRLNSKNYYENKIKVRCLIDDAVQAAAYGEQTSAQLCLAEAKDLLHHQVYYF